MPTKLTPLKVALIALVIGAMAFVINYNWFYGSMPGYQLLLAPGIFAIGFFTEETNFWPKLAILLSGQFLGYYLLVLLVQKLHNFLWK